MLDYNQIIAWAKAEEKEIIDNRHYLHMHPELAFKEFETAEYIRKKLTEYGLTYRTVGTGTIVDIEGGDAPAVALRADIDALPIKEPEGFEFRSTHDGVMHACGHDTHAAMLLGCAKILNEHKAELPGNVRLIFQPAEEGGGGALNMIEANCLNGISSIYCLHVGAGRPIGQFATHPGYIHASSDGYEIRVHGKGCHGASPQAGIDAMVIAAHTILALQEIVSREISAYDNVVLTIGKIQGGEARNILCENVVMHGTLRTVDEKIRQKMHNRMKEVIEGTAKMYRGTGELEFLQCYCSCYNNETETAYATELANEMFGKDTVGYIEKTSMGGEDFGFYQQKVPGAKLYIGTGCTEGIHTPDFRVDEAGLYYGTALLTAIAMKRYAK